MAGAATRETTAVIYTRPKTPRGWGWATQTECTALLHEQERACRSYAASAGLVVNSTLIAPHDSPLVGDGMLRGVGHLIIADIDVVPDLGAVGSQMVRLDMHLHVAETGPVTNWKRP